MNILRRILFLLGIIPVAAYALARWIVTGKDAGEIFERFAEWGGAL